MGNFAGYLVKFGNVELPNSYLRMGECKSTPRQREEIEAYREDYSRNLHRVTANGAKNKYVLAFRSLTDTQMASLKAVMAGSLLDAKQRKYRCTCWDDETLAYKTGDFYIPDITFTWDWVDTAKNVLHYREFEMTLIEY